LVWIFFSKTIPLLFGGVVGWPFLLEGSRPILEELLLPAVEDLGLQTQLIAELRDRLLLQQMPPQDGGPSLPTCSTSVASSCVLSITSLGERLLHFQLNRNTTMVSDAAADAP
jgi:hypothetical protein